MMGIAANTITLLRGWMMGMEGQTIILMMGVNDGYGRADHYSSEEGGDRGMDHYSSERGW